MSSQLITDNHKYYLTPSGASVKLNGTYNSNLEFNIASVYHKSNKIIYSTIRCIHAEIPYSFYLVNEYNNFIAFSFGNVTIPYGNYNANTLRQYLEGATPADMAITFNSATGKFTFTYTMPFSIYSTTTAYLFLGIAKNTTYTSVNNAITMPYLVNILGTRNLYIKLPNMILDNLNTATQDKSTLLNIPVNVSPYSLILYDNRTNTTSIIKNSEIPSTLDLQICDDDNNLVNFNNTEFSITLEIQNYYLLDNLITPTTEF